MKTIIRNKIQVLLAVATSLISLTCAQAQTVIVDNLAETVQNSDFIDPFAWSANSFTTDGTSRPLQSVTLSLGNGDAVSGSFQVQIWNDGGSQPGTSIAALTGNSNPLTANSYTYTPSSSVTLSANTKYWVVATASTVSGSYQWNYTSSTSSSGVGTLGGFSGSTDSGSSWFTEDPSGPYMFNVIAAVPEPSSAAAVFGVLALGFVAASRRLRRG